MKALTLHQPWASLVALGLKNVETRSWSTRYRGPLAIHAGANYKASRNFDAQQAAHGRLSDDQWADMPFGAVVAVCELVAVFPTDDLDESYRFHTMEYPDIADGELLSYPLTGETLRPLNQRWKMEDQWPLGNFGPGRFAWLLGNIRALPEPVPVRGHQGLWNW